MVKEMQVRFHGSTEMHRAQALTWKNDKLCSDRLRVASDTVPVATHEAAEVPVQLKACLPRLNLKALYMGCVLSTTLPMSWKRASCRMNPGLGAASGTKLRSSLRASDVRGTEIP